MLEFETSAGNTYAWDDNVGLFIPLSPTMHSVIKKIFDQKSLSKESVVEQLIGNFNKEEIEFCYDWINKWKRLMPDNDKHDVLQNFHTSDIKDYIIKRGLSQLTLGVTEDCNFRCKYCTYSDFYDQHHGYSSTYMNFTTAKKAIDYFFSLLREGKKYNPIRKSAIGFYGGEPLLNFKLIKECVEYIKNSNSDINIMYGMTTNGSLLDEEKANWLMEHDFVISISLDGPEEEHDRLRVYDNGKGTFKDIMKNINPIMASGYKKIFSLPVYDWKSDLFKREDFFNRTDVPDVLRASLVNDLGGCRYYDQFTIDDRNNYLKQIEIARDFYFKDTYYQTKRDKTSFFDRLVGKGPGDDIFRGVSIYLPPSIMPVTNSCLPGRKIFVDVRGDFHVCEKVNDTFPIGNVDEGLNFKKICDLLKDYFRHMDKCSECKVTRKCGQCFRMFMTDNGFLCSSYVCKKIEAIRKASFARSLSIAEQNPEFVDCKNYRYANIKKHYGD